VISYTTNVLKWVVLCDTGGGIRLYKLKQNRGVRQRWCGTNCLSLCGCNAESVGEHPITPSWILKGITSTGAISSIWMELYGGVCTLGWAPNHHPRA
jgi:hypothetical protein